MDASETVVKLLSHLSIDELRIRFEESNSGDHLLAGSLNLTQFLLATQIDNELNNDDEMISFREGVIELFKQIETRGDGFVRWVDLSAFIMSMEVTTPESPRGVTSGGVSAHSAVGLPPCNYTPVGIVEVERVRTIRSITMLNYPINRIAVIYEGEEVVHLFLPPSPQLPLPPESREHLLKGATIKYNNNQCGGLCRSNRNGNGLEDVNKTDVIQGNSGGGISNDLINEMDTGLTWSVPAQGANSVGIRAPRGGSLLRHHTAYRAHVVLTLTKLDATEDKIAVASTQFYNKDQNQGGGQGNSYISVWDLFSSVVNENERKKKVRQMKKKKRDDKGAGNAVSDLQDDDADEEGEGGGGGGLLNASDPPPPQPRIAERIIITKGYPPTSLVWSRKSNLLFCGNDKDGMVTGWDLKTHTCKVAVKLHEAGITSLAELIREPSGDVIILSGSKDGCISVWDVAKGCAPGRPHSSAASRVSDTARRNYLAKSLELEPEDGVIATLAAHECGVSCMAYASFPWFLLFTAGIYNVKESNTSDIRVFNVQQTSDDEILRPNMKCRHLKGHRGQVTTLLVVVDEAQLVSTDSCGGILVWSLNNGISLAQSLNLHSPPLATLNSCNDVDASAAVASKSKDQTSSRPVSPLQTSRANSSTPTKQSKETSKGDEGDLTSKQQPKVGGRRNVLISPEHLTVKAATIREVSPVLGYKLAAFCPANNGVFTAPPVEAASSSGGIAGTGATSVGLSDSSSVTSSNANGTLNEDEVDLSGESNAVAKSRLKAGYALTGSEDGVGGGGLDMSCLVLGMKTRMLDALAFKSPSVGAPLIYSNFNSYYNSFVTASSKHLCTWDASNGKLTRCFSAQQICGDADNVIDTFIENSFGDITAVVLEPLGRHIVVGDSQGKINIIDYITGARVKSMDPHATGAVVRLCYEFKCVVSFGGGSLPLQVCDDCDPAGYSESTDRSVKLRSLTFKGLVKSDLAEGGAKNPHDVNVDAGSDDGSDMTSSDEESEEEEEGERDIMHTPYGMDGSTGGDDYGSNDSYSTAGESGTYATQSSYSYSISANNEQWNKNTKNNGAGTGNGIGDSSLVDGWIAIVHAKLAATKLARRMKRKLAVDMARRANDHDLAKALPEAVDGCVSPHMNMIALLSYGGGGKGGSGYHLQIWDYEMFNFIGTCVIPDRYQYKENEFSSIYTDTYVSRTSPGSGRSSPKRRGSSKWDTIRRQSSVFLTAAPLPETPPRTASRMKANEKTPCLPTKVVFLDPYPILAAACDDRTVRLWALPSLTFIGTLTAPPPSKIPRQSSSPPLSPTSPTSPSPSSFQTQTSTPAESKVYGKDIDELTSLLWVPGNIDLNSAVIEEKSKIEYMKSHGVQNKNKNVFKKAQVPVRNYNCHHIFAGDSAGRIVNWQFNLNEFDDVLSESANAMKNNSQNMKTPQPSSSNPTSPASSFANEFMEQNHSMGNSLSSLVDLSSVCDSGVGQPVTPRRGPNFNPHRVACADVTLSTLRSFNKSQFNVIEQLKLSQKRKSQSSGQSFSSRSFKYNGDEEDGETLGASVRSGRSVSDVSFFGSLRRCSGQWVAHGTGLPPSLPPGSAPGTPPPPNPVIQSLHWMPYKPNAHVNSSRCGNMNEDSRMNNIRNGGMSTNESASNSVFSLHHYQNLLCAGGGVLLSSSNDGTARLWRFHHQDNSDDNDVNNNVYNDVKCNGWRVPVCLGELDSHTPEPTTSSQPNTVLGHEHCDKHGNRDVKWMFDPHTVLDNEKNHIGPSEAPPLLRGPNPSAISEFSEYIMPKRIPANFKRRKPTYLEERKEASLIEFNQSMSSPSVSDDGFREDDSTANSSLASESSLLSNAGTRADEAVGGGPKRGKIGALGQMGHGKLSGSHSGQPGNSSVIESIVKELKITTPSVLKIINNKKIVALRKEEESMKSPSSLLIDGGHSMDSFDMDGYLSSLDKCQDTDSEFNWGGMFDSLTQFENDLAHWGESRPPNPYLNRAPRRRASPPCTIEPFDKNKYLTTSREFKIKKSNTSRAQNNGTGGSLTSSVVGSGSLDKHNFGAREILNSGLNTSTISESGVGDNRTSTGDGRVSRSGKNEGKLLRMADSTDSGRAGNYKSTESENGVVKPNVYGNIGNVGSVHMRRLNKLRHMGY